MDRVQFIRLFNSIGLVGLNGLPKRGEKIKVTNIQSGEEWWALCDGRRLNRETYAELFNIIGGHFSAAGNTIYFNLPSYARQAILDMEAYADAQGTFPFVKCSGKEGVPIGSVVNFKIGPDDIEVDPKAVLG